MTAQLLATHTGYIHADDIDPMGYLAGKSDDLAKATDYKLHISGYANAHIMVHDGMPRQLNPAKNLNKPLIQLSEASLFIDGTLPDNLLFSTEIDLSIDFSKDGSSGHTNRGEFLVNYYYLDYDVAGALDWDVDEYGNFSVRGGRILVPFNDYNENKANFEQSLMSQPFTAWQVVPVNNVPISFHQFGWTDIGVTFDWSYNVATAGIVDLKLSLINGLGEDGSNVLDANAIQLDAPNSGNPTARTRDGLFANKSDWDNFNDNNSNQDLVLKLSYKLADLPLDFGTSWYSGKWDDAGEKNLEMFGLHLNYIEKNWRVQGEWVRAEVDQTAGLNPVNEPGPVNINTSADDYVMQSWYVQTSYVPYRYHANGSQYVRLIASYDEVYTNKEAFFTSFNRYRVSLGAEWAFINNVRIRYEWQQHTLRDFDNAPAAFREAGGSEHIYVNMLSIMAFFQINSEMKSLISLYFSSRLVIVLLLSFTAERVSVDDLFIATSRTKNSLYHVRNDRNWYVGNFCCYPFYRMANKINDNPASRCSYCARSHSKR